MAIGAAVPSSFLVPLASRLQSAEILLSEFQLLKEELGVDMTGLVRKEVAASCAEAVPLPVEVWRRE